MTRLRTRARALLPATTTLAALCALALGAAAPAHAAAPRVDLNPVTHTPLPLPGFGDMVPDDALNAVFVSGGPTGNSVVEVGYDGTVVKTLDKEYGATGMVLSADGSTLYVALAGGDAISAIDTATFTEKARYTTPAHTCPTYLARTGAQVWAGYGCGDAWNGGVGVLDTSADSPQIVLGKQDTKTDVHYSAAPRLAAAAGADGPLAVSQPGLSPVNLATYQTDGAALKLLQSAPRGGSDLADLAAAPDGSALFTASGSESTIDAFAPSTLADTGAYRTGAFPTAVAVSPDGTEIATTSEVADAQVYVWNVGSSSPVGDYRMPLTRTPAQHGLAFGHGGSLLFFVTQPEQSGSGPVLTELAAAGGQDS